MKKTSIFGTYSITGSVISLALALLLAGCGSSGSAGTSASTGTSGAAGTQAAKSSGQYGQGGARNSAIFVMASTVNDGPLTVQSDTSGTVNAVMQSNVVAQIAGTVLKVNHRAGDWVKAGETVVQLDDSQLALTVKTAQSNLENAKINLETSTDTTAQANPKLKLDVQAAEASLAAAQKNYDAQSALYKVGGATSAQVDSAQSQLQAAQSSLQAAKTNLDQNNKADKQSLAQLRIAVEQAQNQVDQAVLNLKYAAVKAPFDGQLSVLNLVPGEYVGTNTTAFVLVSPAKEIDFSVPPSDSPHLTIGTKLSFTFNGTVYPITVRQLPSAPVNSLVPMVASPPPSFPLSYGTVGTVSYSLALAHGIIVPIASLQTQEDKNYVFTIEGGKAKTRFITVVAESGITAAVSGIPTGSQIIVSPPPGLLDGSAVQVVQGSQPSAEGQNGNGASGAKPVQSSK